MGPKSTECCPYKEVGGGTGSQTHTEGRQVRTQRRGEEGYVLTEAETGEMGHKPSDSKTSCVWRLEGAGEMPPYSLGRECGPAGPLLSDVSLQTCEGRND